MTCLRTWISTGLTIATLSLTLRAQHVLAELDGGADTAFGQRAAFVGDVDGDGFEDVAVAARLADAGGTNAGTVSVYQGLTGALLWSVDGTNAEERYGYGLDGGGDIDNLGGPDVIIGSESGIYEVRSGSDGSLIHAGGLLLGEPCMVACGGYIDSDDFADYLVAYPRFNFSNGRVYVYSGRTHSVINIVDGTNCSGTGTGIAVCGDINLDGFDDYIVGSPDQCFGGGAFKVYSGDTHAVLFGFDNFFDKEFGYSVDGAGDVDGDGVLDVVVGARELSFGPTVDGFVEIWSGATGLEIRHADGVGGGNFFGTNVSRLGDLDGDGFDEVLGSGPGESFAQAGTARVLSGFDFSNLFATEGELGEFWGASIDGGGDFNGDGTPDFLVGATPLAGPGRVVIYSGAVPSSSDEFCFGNGGALGCTACPCLNDGPTSSTGGCINGVGNSGKLSVLGNPSLSNGTLSFDLRGANPSTFAILASGVNALPQMGACPPGTGILSPALDGLRCVGGNLLRHGTRPTDANGDVGLTTNAWSHPSGMTAGQTRHFQSFYRESPVLGCGNGQNTSNAISIAFAP